MRLRTVFDFVKCLILSCSLDGRVYVKSSKGKSYAVRLDMEMAGIMLLRDADSGEVYGLQTEGFQQVRGGGTVLDVECMLSGGASY